MFAPASQPTDDDSKIKALAASMRYIVEREGTLTPRVGYTYLAQFIGHDLSHDVAPMAGPMMPPEETPNYRTPFLDLDHLYGGGPETAAHLYTGSAGAELFKIGATQPGGYLRDVPIESGELLVADPGDRRNLDNLILRQLQVVFLLFHNEAVRQLSANGGELQAAVGLEDCTPFAAARRLVRWHYQWIMRHDFLPRILHNSFWSRPRRRRAVCSAVELRIPVEFTLAAFRYGHSVVRRVYPINCRRERVELYDLLRAGHEPHPIPDDLLIEWGSYFDGLPRSGPPATSSFFDTAIVEPLHAIPPATLRLCSHVATAGESARLAERTLLRGARAQLASGQEVAAALVAQRAITPEDELSIDELTSDTCNESGSVLRTTGLHRNTPLFYYLLKEAELRASGFTLGPIGSYIIGEVLLGALEADPEGYVAVHGAQWRPPRWEFATGAHGPVNSLAAMIRLVGAHTLLPDCARRASALAPPPMRDVLLRATIATP